MLHQPLGSEVVRSSRLTTDRNALKPIAFGLTLIFILWSVSPVYAASSPEQELSSPREARINTITIEDYEAQEAVEAPVTETRTLSNFLEWSDLPLSRATKPTPTEEIEPVSEPDLGGEEPKLREKKPTPLLEHMDFGTFEVPAGESYTFELPRSHEEIQIAAKPTFDHPDVRLELFGYDSFTFTAPKTLEKSFMVSLALIKNGIPKSGEVTFAIKSPVEPERPSEPEPPIPLPKPNPVPPIEPEGEGPGTQIPAPITPADIQVANDHFTTVEGTRGVISDNAFGNDVFPEDGQIVEIELVDPISPPNMNGGLFFDDNLNGDFYFMLGDWDWHGEMTFTYRVKVKGPDGSGGEHEIWSEVATVTYTVNPLQTAYTNEATRFELGPLFGDAFARIHYQLSSPAHGKVRGLGDLDGDGYVTIMDIRDIMNLIMSGQNDPADANNTTDPMILLAADIDGSGGPITQADAQALSDLLNDENAQRFAVYMPDEDYIGADSFIFISDDGTTTEENSVEIEVTDPPPTPTPSPTPELKAVDDQINANEGTTTIQGDVSSNDSFPWNASTEITRLPVPANRVGNFHLNPDGKFDFIITNPSGQEPDPDWSGTIQFQYRIRYIVHADPDPLHPNDEPEVLDIIVSDPATVTITVSPVDDPLTVRNTTLTMQEDGDPISSVVYVPFHPTAGLVTDPDDRYQLSLEAMSTLYGTGTLERVPAAGGLPEYFRFRYVPFENVFGTEQFKLWVKDEQGNDVLDAKGDPVFSLITVLIAPVNDPPVAQDDSGYTLDGRSKVIDVLRNDSDPVEEDDISIVSVSAPPSQGTATILSDGTIRYRPHSGASGNDSFEYTIKDAKGATATATVAIHNNHRPIITLDQTMTVYLEDMPIELYVRASDPDGDPLKFYREIVYYDGTSGGYKELDHVHPDPDNEPNGYRVRMIYNFTSEGSWYKRFKVEDPHTMGERYDAIRIIVLDSPSPSPTPSPTPTPEAPMDTSRTTPLLTPEAEGLPAPPMPEAITPADIQVADDHFSTIEGNHGVITDNAFQNDVFPEDGEILEIEIVDPISPPHMNGGLYFDESLNGDFGFMLGDREWHGDMTFTYRVKVRGPDGNGGEHEIWSEVATVTYTVNPLHTAYSNEATRIEVGSFFGDAFARMHYEFSDPAHGKVRSLGDVSGDGYVDILDIRDLIGLIRNGQNDPDDPNNTIDPMILLAADMDGSGGPITQADAQALSGLLNDENAQRFAVYMPDEDYIGADSFTFTSFDGTNTEENTIAISVTNQVSAVDDQVNLNEGGSAQINVLDNDNAPADSWVEFTDIPNIPASVGTITWGMAKIGQAILILNLNPNSEWSGSFTVKYKITEPAESEEATVTFNVAPIDDPLTVRNTTRSMMEDAEDPLVIAVYSPLHPTAGLIVDPDNRYQLALRPALHGTANIVRVPATQTTNEFYKLVYSPNESFNGTENILIYVLDEQGNAVLDQAGNRVFSKVIINVTPVYDPPIANDDSAHDNYGHPHTLDIRVLDNDADDFGGTLSIIGTSDPSHGTVKITPEQTILYRPQTDHPGTDSFTYQVRDANGETATATVTITVNRPPIVFNDSVVFHVNDSIEITMRAEGEEDEQLEFQIWKYSPLLGAWGWSRKYEGHPDPDNPPNGFLSSVSFPHHDEPTEYTVRFRASDDYGVSAQGRIKISVVPEPSPSPSPSPTPESDPNSNRLTPLLTPEAEGLPAPPQANPSVEPEPMPPSAPANPVSEGTAFVPKPEEPTREEALAALSEQRDQDLIDAQKAYRESEARIKEELERKLAEEETAYHKRLAELALKHKEVLSSLRTRKQTRRQANQYRRQQKQLRKAFQARIKNFKRQAQKDIRGAKRTWNQSKKKIGRDFKFETRRVKRTYR